MGGVKASGYGDEDGSIGCYGSGSGYGYASGDLTCDASGSDFGSGSNSCDSFIDDSGNPSRDGSGCGFANVSGCKRTGI